MGLTFGDAFLDRERHLGLAGQAFERAELRTGGRVLAPCRLRRRDLAHHLLGHTRRVDTERLALAAEPAFSRMKAPPLPTQAFELSSEGNNPVTVGLDAGGQTTIVCCRQGLPRRIEGARELPPLQLQIDESLTDSRPLGLDQKGSSGSSGGLRRISSSIISVSSSTIGSREVIGTG